MRLYTPGLPSDYARHVIDQGFVGLPRAVYDAEELDAATRDTPEGEITPPEKLLEPTDVAECCEFRATCRGCPVRPECLSYALNGGAPTYAGGF
jgi:hypothetical protein